MANPRRPGLPARQTHDHRRNGLTSFYAALEVASGRVIGECARGRKVVSLFEAHTEIIPKRKLAKPTEFGRLVKIQET